MMMRGIVVALTAVLATAPVALGHGLIPPGLSPSGPKCERGGGAYDGGLLGLHRRLQLHGQCQNVSTWAPPFPPGPNGLRTPIMLVPPMLGSSIDSKLTDASGLPWPVCDSTTNWTQIWLPPGMDAHCDSKKDPRCLPTDLLPLYADCWAHNLQLVIDPTTGRASAPPGIQTRLHTGLDAVCGFGMDCTCKALRDLGWDLSNTSQEVDGYAYDWRMGPIDWSATGGYYSKLKSGFERLQARHGEPVVAISFSLGGPVLSTFLSSYVDQAWKDKHIKSWVSYSGVSMRCVHSQRRTWYRSRA